MGVKLAAGTVVGPQWTVSLETEVLLRLEQMHPLVSERGHEVVAPLRRGKYVPDQGRVKTPVQDLIPGTMSEWGVPCTYPPLAMPVREEAN